MKKERIFNIIIHEAEEGGYWAECPSLEGCYSQGETIEVIHVNMKEGDNASDHRIRSLSRASKYGRTRACSHWSRSCFDNRFRGSELAAMRVVSKTIDG